MYVEKMKNNILDNVIMPGKETIRLIMFHNETSRQPNRNSISFQSFTKLKYRDNREHIVHVAVFL